MTTTRTTAIISLLFPRMTRGPAARGEALRIIRVIVIIGVAVIILIIGVIIGVGIGIREARSVGKGRRRGVTTNSRGVPLRSPIW